MPRPHEDHEHIVPEVLPGQESLPNLKPSSSSEELFKKSVEVVGKLKYRRSVTFSDIFLTIDSSILPELQELLKYGKKQKHRDLVTKRAEKGDFRCQLAVEIWDFEDAIEIRQALINIETDLLLTRCLNALSST